MAEWALYLDETGSPEPHSIPLQNGMTPAFTLAGICLPIDRWREYDRSYLYLKREFFAKEIDRSSKIDCFWEIKGADLFSPRNANSERNKVFTYKVLDIVKEFGGKAMGVTFLKGVRKPMPKASMYTKGLQIIVERYNAFLQEVGSKGVLILDSRTAHTRKGGGLDYIVAVSCLSFVFGNNEGRTMKQIIEAPLFADSGLTVGLQMADIVSGMIYANTYREKLAPTGASKEQGYVDYTHMARFNQPLREIVFESAQAYNGGRKMYGLRHIDHRDIVSSSQLAALQKTFARD